MKALKMLGAAIGALAVLAATLYAALLFINRADRAPNAAALALERLIAAAPEIPDQDNAYVYLLGFAAPRATDPAAAGRARAAWIRADRTLNRDSDPQPGRPESSLYGYAGATALLAPCGERNTAACFESLASGASLVDALIEEHGWLLERYRSMLARRAWRQVDTYDLRGPVAGFSEAQQARIVLFLETWRSARRGDAGAVRTLLGSDLAFWRAALRESDLLVHKMTIASFIAIHFAWGNVVLTRLPSDAVGAAIPPSWEVPFDEPERSLRRANAGELMLAKNAVTSLKETGYLFPVPAADRQPISLAQRLNHRMMLPLLQPQDYLNKRAVELEAFAAASEAPLTELAARLAIAQRDAAAARGGLHAYNFFGSLLLAAEGADFARLASRVADLEGVRRAALLAAAVRSRDASAQSIVATDLLRNPYNGEPFSVDSGARQIVFVGRESTVRGRHAFLW